MNDLMRNVAENCSTITQNYMQAKAILETVEEIQITSKDPLGNSSENIAKIATQTIYLTTQVAEVAFKNNESILPILNCASGAADVIKTSVEGYINQENLSTVAIKIAEKLFDHTVDAANNLTKTVHIDGVPRLIITAATAIKTAKAIAPLLAPKIKEVVDSIRAVWVQK